VHCVKPLFDAFGATIATIEALSHLLSQIAEALVHPPLQRADLSLEVVDPVVGPVRSHCLHVDRLEDETFRVARRVRHLCALSPTSEATIGVDRRRAD
jgi:hypothetical protein